ncbi:3-ketoacyl-acyl carrier protein synthase I [Perilla frutescens var. frutescens]|nr:3-ketoacyl-acyl carrier protein synthase I [Perilla frutescens var. frutescens]
MSSIVCTSSSTTLIFNRWKQSRNSRDSLFQYNGLKSVKTTQLGSSSLDTKGFVTAARCGKIKAMASPKRETDAKKRIVITGMGLVSVFGSDVDAYYNKLLDGVSGITPIDRFDASEYSVGFGGQIRDFSSKGYIDGKNDRRLDDCWRYCFVAGKRALDHAGLGKQVIDTMEKTRMGVLVGSGMGGVKSFSNGVEALVEKGHKKITPFFIPYVISNMGSALLAIDTGFMGPNYSIAAACATSNHCFIAAANHIRRGDADVMVAGGTDAALTPIGVAGFIACRALSQRNNEPHKASRPWDRNRDGFVLGEGAGVLIMESLEHAMKRGAKVYAEFLGGAATCDAHHMTDPHPDGLGVSSCIVKSLQDAGVAPEESMIGHALGAAGALEAIATIKAINTGWLHPTINQYDLEPNVTIDTVPNVKKQHQVNVAISNSFGFGGHNSVVVFAPFGP